MRLARYLPLALTVVAVALVVSWKTTPVESVSDGLVGQKRQLGLKMPPDSFLVKPDGKTVGAVTGIRLDGHSGVALEMEMLIPAEWPLIELGVTSTPLPKSGEPFMPAPSVERAVLATDGEGTLFVEGRSVGPVIAPGKLARLSLTRNSVAYVTKDGRSQTTPLGSTLPQGAELILAVNRSVEKAEPQVGDNAYKGLVMIKADYIDGRAR